MKVNDLISVMLNCDNVRIFSGTVGDLNRQRKHLDDTIVEAYIQVDSLVLNTRQSYKDSPVVKNVKNKMLNTAMNLSFVDFGTFLLYYRDAIQKLYCLKLVDNDEYKYLLKCLYNIDLVNGCYRE